MSMPKGTPPSVREWVQCSLSDFRQALNSMRNAKIVITHITLHNQEIYSEKWTPLARHYHYKKSEQCLIHQSMRQHLPEKRVINHAGSIYDNVSHVKLF